MMMNIKDVEYVIDAHTNHSIKPSKSFRKWDQKTPYHIHPIWCASMLSTETQLDETTRVEGVQALLYHDILEDTTKQIPEWISKKVKKLIEDMTFEGGSGQEIVEIWYKPKEIRLYKLYDKVSNLLDGVWMNEVKKNQYQKYVEKLCEDVEKIFGELNITRIAKVV